MNPTGKSALKALRLLLGLALLAWVFLRIDGAAFSTAIARSSNHPGLVLGALGLTFAGLFAGLIRWHQLLRGLGFNLPFSASFKLLFIGQFFNTFLLGACGGDVVRGYYLAKDTESGSRTEAVSTVLADRLAGLLFLMVTHAVLFVWQPHYFNQHPVMHSAALLVTITGLLVLCAILLLQVSRGFRRRLRVPPSWATRGPAPFIQRGLDALVKLATHRRILTYTLLASGMNALCLAGSMALFGRALELDMPGSHYFILYPLITITAAVPITPGALGIRENLFIFLFGLVGISTTDAFTLSLLVFLGGVLWGLPGWLFFMRRTAKGSMGEELARIRQKPL